jgi:hypothetical protein
MSVSPKQVTCLHVAVALTLLGLPTAASAHEPLWGETPTIFGPGVFHGQGRLQVEKVEDRTLLK